jgi:type I restriction enzyme M protein
VARQAPTVALGDMATIYSGLSLPPADDLRSAARPLRSVVGRGTLPVKLVSYKHVRDGEVSTDLDVSMTDDERRVAPYRIVPGDVLMTARGSSLRVGVVPSGFPPAFLTTTLLGIRLGGDYSPAVLAHYLMTAEGRASIAAISSGVVNLSISPRALADLRIPFIPLEVQRKLEELLVAHAAARKAADAALQHRDRLVAAISKHYLHEANA